MKCQICEARKARRDCPGVRGEICSICCGTERENSVDCPFDCIYLREAREREPQNSLDARSLPNADIRIPDRFLEEHGAAAAMVISSVAISVLETPGAIDYDVREALESLIRTYRTLQSGLVYETRPNNPVAGRIYEEAQRRIAEQRAEITKNAGSSVRDAEILGALVLIQRMEYRDNNGRKRGRAFIDFMRSEIGETAAASPASSSLIVQP